MHEPIEQLTKHNFSTLVADAVTLAQSGRRRILGIAGAPGSGKSTLALALDEALGERSVAVPMDGFHLAQRELKRLGREERKGAIDTFDGSGFVALLRRLAAPTDDMVSTEDIVYAPSFDRSIEEPVAASIPVPKDVPLVIVEGNYLLVETPPWSSVRELLDECWFVITDDALRIKRLMARHQQFGRSPETAMAFAHGSDQLNAELVAATADRAQRRLDVTDWQLDS